MTTQTSFPKEKIRILLLEGLHEDGVQRLKDEGFQVDERSGALDEDELMREIESVFVLGIRSKTHLTDRVLQRAKRLLAVGAFCIGTNQIDLEAATERGIPVFNAPYSNTRSVAELVIGNIVMLLRGLTDKIRAAHEGIWKKSASGSVEVRGKTLGIIGYGHIGRQVSVLAEALGMRVLFFDIADKLSMGNAEKCGDMRDVLARSDIVTLHVPDTPSTRGMIGKPELDQMRDGSFLINTSRGTVVDIDALKDALTSGRLAGAAIDVFPEEPKKAGEVFSTPLQGLPNVVLTPHIGGSTMEAQRSIGLSVASKLSRFINNGCTEGAVNFPNVVLPELTECHRILHIHQNVPGVMQKVNTMFAEAGINIAAQHLRTHGNIGYLIMDTNRQATLDMVRQLSELPESIRVRALF